MKIAAPKLPVVLDERHDITLATDDSLEAQHLVLPVAAGVVTAVSLDECKLEKPLFAQARLEKATLRDTDVLSGEMSALRMQDAGMQRVVFKDCRMTGFDISRSTLKDVQFVGCKLTMANIRFAKLQNVLFEDCILTDADFQGVQCKNVAFKHCTLERISIHGTQLQAVDFRTSQLRDIKGWKDAKGITIDSAQLMSVAAELALALDIVISDD